MTRKHHKTRKGHGPSGEEPKTHVLYRQEPTQGGLLVSEEHDNIVKECRERVKTIAATCRARNRKFRDVEFDLRDRELCLLDLADKPSDPQRVTEIFKNPRFYVGGANPNDIAQGHLDDCWFLSALATMSTTEQLVEKFCVERDEEIGVYGFVFFRDAKWVIVIIDDFLYTSIPKFEQLSREEQRLYHDSKDNYNNIARKHAKNLYFAKSNRTEADGPEETWVPLIEKAYAKLHGNYAALNSGYAGEAIEDLTGGVTSLISTKDILSRDDFWRNELLNAHNRLFACSFDALNQVRDGEYNVKVNGLIGAHAYSVLRALEYKGKRFIVLRNPWGAVEWDGPWSDGSKEWSDEWFPALKELKHSFGNDGQFVMEYKDFLESWETIDRTLLFDSSWIMSSEWLRVEPRRSLEWSYGDVSFTISLQRTSPVIIVLSKLDERYFRELASVSNWTFDFLVFKRGEKNPVATSSPSVFLTQRSVNAEFEELEAGQYVVRLDNQYSTHSKPKLEAIASGDDTFPYLSSFICDPNSRSTRVLFRGYAEKLRGQLTASNFDKSMGSKYLSTPLDTIAGKDLSELDDSDDEERTNVPLEEQSGKDGEPVNSPTAPGDNPQIDGSSDEEDQDQDKRDDEVTVPEFLHPDKETTVVLGLRVYTHKSSQVEIKGHCRRHRPATD